MAARMRHIRTIEPPFPRQELNYHQVAGVQTFHFDRDIDQAIGFYHRR